jgi:ligand-binding sensor domain-containing protein
LVGLRLNSLWLRVVLGVLGCGLTHLFGQSSAAPASWSTRIWQASDGLTDGRVTGIVQTPDGYIWVAPLGRLVRFNGAEFDAFLYKEISDQLDISMSTVRTHIHAVYEKLHVQTRTEAVLKFLGRE